MNSIDRMFTSAPAAFARSYIEHVTNVFRSISPESIGRFIEVLLDARKRGATIFFVGNGGSAATASHFANDLAIGTRSTKRPFRALSLTDNNAVLTAIANDRGYAEVFAEQLTVLGTRGDVLVGISASGNSPNVIRAFEVARNLGIATISITAFDGGKMKQISSDGIHVPTEMGEYGPAEDAHMMIDHLVGAFLMNLVKAEVP